MRPHRGVSVGIILAAVVMALATAPATRAQESVPPASIEPAGTLGASPEPASDGGWRLLGERRGSGKRRWTAIATDEGAYRRVWENAGLTGARPDVDLESEVVIWFGAGIGPDCADLRLDAVVVEADRSVVHAVISPVDTSAPCATDADPYAFVVALARDRLPAGPFVIQLDADGPRAETPEERAIVLVDLSKPGSVLRRRDIQRGTMARAPSAEPSAIGPGAAIEADEPSLYRFDPACGIEWLGPLNGAWWQTDVPSGTEAYVPAEWLAALDDTGLLPLRLLLRSEPAPLIEAEANGLTVTYTPSVIGPPGCVPGSDTT
jgi:hypothetical protein